MLAKAPMRKIRIVGDGKPLANAIVIAGNVWAAMSGADGTIEVPQINNASPRLAVLHPDFAPLLPSQLQASTTDIKLVRGVELRGKVVAQDGKTAVPHARVWIGTLTTTETGDDGTFVIAHAPSNWSSLRVSAGAAGSGFAANSNASPYTIRLRPSGAIAGTVRDSKSRAAVGGMRVALNPTYDLTSTDWALTDAKGVFSFEELPPGQYAITAIHPGYTLDQRPTVPLAPGERVTRMLAATPFARVRGIVVDEDKKAVGGAFVVRGLGGSLEGQRSVGVTNARGEFMLRAPAPANEVDLQALKQGYASGSSKAKLVAGETASGVSITLPRGIPLTVRVVDAEKKPVPDAAVTLMFWRGDAFGMRLPISRCDGGACITDAEGIVGMRIAPGKYDVQVAGETLVPKTMGGQTIDAKSSPLTVTVERGVEVAGRVVYADNKPVPDATVTLQSPAQVQKTATTDSSGAFSFKNAPRGAATIQASLGARSGLASGKKDVTAPSSNLVITMPHGGTITGHVIDDATHAPVTDFQVTTMHSGIMSNPLPVQSSDGSFSVRNVAPGSTEVQVTARGYTPGSAPGVEVEEGKASSDVEIHLEHGATLKGRVTSSDGQPVEGVNIFVDDSGRRLAFVAPGRDSTDANGSYAIEGVTPGTRTVMFNKSGFVAQRKTIEAASGKEVALDVTLDRGRELRGKVIDESGRPVAMADVRVEGEQVVPVRTDSEGAFVIGGLKDAHARIVARKSGYVEARLDDVDPNTSVTLTLKRGGTISGQVTGVSDSELQYVSVVAHGPGGAVNARADATGRFTLEGLADGRFMVEASLNGQQMRRTPSKAVEVINGSAPPVALAFGEGYTLRGRVTAHGQPLGGSMITFGPANGQGSGSSAQIDPDGSYVAAGLSSGEFTVVITSPIYGGVYLEKTTVSGSGVYDVDVRSSVVRGRVVDARSGVPLADVQISFQPAERGAATVSVRPMSTDFQGRFASGLVPERKWRVRVQREKYQTAFVDVDVAPGAPDLDVRLEPAQSAIVHVVDARSGSPVSGAFVNAYDASSKPVFNAQTREDGTVQLWLGQGHYTLNVAAQRYAIARGAADVPGPEVRIALERSGRIVVESPPGARVRLSGGALGAPMMSFNGRFENVRPGTYVLELMSNDNKPIDKRQVVVIEAQTTTVSF
jgi:protocatechuate 3,4-dioxygenase beta subunit